jgi:hypothetical protein
VWLITLPLRNLPVAPGEPFRIQKKRGNLLTDLQAGDYTMIWGTLSASHGDYGRLVGCGMVLPLPEYRSKSLAIRGEGLIRWWGQTQLEAARLEHLIPHTTCPQQSDKGSLNRLLREDACLSSSQYSRGLVKQPAWAESVVEPPPRKERGRMGPVEREVVWLSAKGSGWRPGRGRW